MSKLKIGKSSKKEKQFIIQNANLMSVKDIANRLRRSEAFVKKIIAENDIEPNNLEFADDDVVKLRTLLYSRTYWAEVKKQLNNTELDMFEDTWIRMMQQFNMDVVYSEELQIKQWIMIEILINRVMRRRAEFIKEEEKMQRKLASQIKLPKNDRDKVLIKKIDLKLKYSKSSLSSFNTDHTRLLAEQKKISQDLKATRDKRVERIEDSKTTWTGLLKLLEDEKFRKDIGEEIEIFRMAMDKKEQELSEFHNYADDTQDLPLYNLETHSQYEE